VCAGDPADATGAEAPTNQPTESVAETPTTQPTEPVAEESTSQPESITSRSMKRIRDGCRVMVFCGLILSAPALE